MAEWSMAVVWLCFAGQLHINLPAMWPDFCAIFSIFQSTLITDPSSFAHNSLI
jgi:hypothetical protein